jgi:hypothetical protein
MQSMQPRHSKAELEIDANTVDLVVMPVPKPHASSKEVQVNRQSLELVEKEPLRIISRNSGGLSENLQTAHFKTQ